jgi:argininosuccinate synthase
MERVVLAYSGGLDMSAAVPVAARHVRSAVVADWVGL